MKVLARINRTTDAGNLAPRTGLYTQLRKTPFSASAVTGTEIDTGLYEFDVTGTNLTAYLKLYVSTDNSTFTEYESWGGTDGIRQKEYLSYVSIVSQVGPVPPTDTVLVNEFGSVSWSRQGDGSYHLDCPDITISQSKLVCFNGTGETVTVFYQVEYGGVHAVNIQTGVFVCDFGTEEFNFVLYDGLLLKVPIEIRLYP